MLTLLLSLIALAAGPVIYQILIKKRVLISFIDGFVFTSIAGLFLTHVFGHHYDNYFLVILLLALGFLGPNILEKVFSRYEASIHKLFILVGVVGLIFHVFIDGAVLSTTINESHLIALQFAILIHRIPAGLTLWWILRPKYSFTLSVCAVILMLIATTVGFFFGAEITHDSKVLDYLQVLVAGSILHVVFFKFHLDPHKKAKKTCCHHEVRTNEERSPLLEGFGNIVGIILVVFIYNSGAEATHAHHGESESLLTEIIHYFIHLYSVSAPALLLAFFLSSMVYSFLKLNSFRWINKGSSFVQSIKGMIFGLPLPICSCGVLPFYKSLVQKGIATSTGLAFLIATPELGIDAFLISLPLLGADLTMARLLAAIVLAISVALILTPYAKKQEIEVIEDEVDNLSFKEKLVNGFKYGFMELVDSTGPWILAGITIGAFIAPYAESFNLNLPYGLDIIIFGLFGVVVYVCASGATPLVAVLLAGGVSPGAAIAFLLTGPATNISTFGVLSEIHSKAFAIRFALFTTLIAWAVGYVVNFVFTDFSFSSLVTSDSSHDSQLNIICAYLVSIVFIFSLLRQGGRKFIGRILD